MRFCLHSSIDKSFPKTYFGCSKAETLPAEAGGESHLIKREIAKPYNLTQTYFQKHFRTTILDVLCFGFPKWLSVLVERRFGFPEGLSALVERRFGFPEMVCNLMY